MMKRGNSPTVSEIESVEAKARTEAASRTRDGGDSTAREKIASVMSSQVSEAIRKEMDRISDGLKQIISDPNLNISQKTAKSNDLQKEYCEHLALMKRFNGGTLPQDLAEEWETNLCGRFNI